MLKYAIHIDSIKFPKTDDFEWKITTKEKQKLQFTVRYSRKIKIPCLTIEKLSEWIHRVDHRERNVKRIEEGQGKGEIRFEGGNGLQKEYYLFSKFLKSSVLRKVAVSLWPQIVSESFQEIRGYGMCACLHVLGKWLNFLHFSNFTWKEINSRSREREDTTRKFFRVNFLIESIDSINEIGSDFIGQNYMKSINSDFLIN